MQLAWVLLYISSSNKATSLEMITICNQQQGARDVGSNTNIIVRVTYQHDPFQLTGKRPKQHRRHTPQQQITHSTSPRIVLQRVLGKRTTCRSDTRTNVCHWFLTWRPSTTTTFAWRSLTAGTIFPLVFHVEKVIPCFLVHPPHAISLGEKHVCNKAHHSVCVLLPVHILLARVQTMSMCPNSYNTPLEAGDAAIRTAAVWLFLAQ